MRIEIYIFNDDEQAMAVEFINFAKETMGIISSYIAFSSTWDGSIVVAINANVKEHAALTAECARLAHEKELAEENGVCV